MQTELFTRSRSRSRKSSSSVCSSSSRSSPSRSSTRNKSSKNKRIPPSFELWLNYTLSGMLLEASPSLERNFGLSAFNSLGQMWANQCDFEKFRQWHEEAVSSMKSGPKKQSNLTLAAPKTLLQSDTGSARVLFEADFVVTMTDVLDYQLAPELWEFYATVKCRRLDQHTSTHVHL
eukprot:TRINITY_DN65792_c0_g1_i1.p1 TRINITY_DN65792_c0_g1~~TRINITY_DN65792_c0_g1_i1.p1  ORF type:complete len:202 (-),score=21.61 TRINITY_DN65792_c0_g1_i1:120-647(-)